MDPRFTELTPELLLSLEPYDIGHAVVQHVGIQIELTGDDHAKILGRLAPGVLAIYATWWVDCEVKNGGFNQFFYNPHGVLAGEALKGFELFGAEKIADVMRAAIATYESERDLLAPYHDPGTLEAFAESYKHTELGKLDERYYDVADELYDRWKAAILKNPELFSDG